MKLINRKLGDGIHIKHGFAFLGEYFSDQGKYILLTPGNFYEKGGFKSRPEKDRYYIGTFPSDYLLKKDDLIVAMTEQGPGLLGSSAFIPEDNTYLHNQRLGLVDEIDKELFDKKYLYNLFNSRGVRSQIYGSATGTKVRHTSPGRIYKVKVLVPDVVKQKEISSIIENYSQLIDGNRRRIQLLEESARLLFREWFVYFRFPGHEKVKIIKDGISKTPEGWVKEKVVNVVKRVAPGELYDQATAEPTGIVPILDQGQSGIIGYHNNEPSVIASLDNPVIVFANHTCNQRIIHFPFSVIQNIFPFLPCDENCRNIYWLHYATDNLVQLNAYKGHWPEFMAKNILLPPEDLCDEFGNIISMIHKQIFYLSIQNQKRAQARDLLLPRLMSGAIEV